MGEMEETEETEEIELDKLIAYRNFPLDHVRGVLLNITIDSISNRKTLRPILVRPADDGKYEIIDGHYRVAAARKLGFHTVPAIIHSTLSDEEAQKYFSPYTPVGLWVRYDINICDSQFMESEQYKQHEEDILFVGGIILTLGEYIKHFFLTEWDAYQYESFYCMGNPYELSEEECRYEAIAAEIVNIMAKDSPETLYEYENPEEKEIAINKVVNELTNHICLIKEYLGIDLNQFDYKNIQNQRERAKILYFFYMMKNRDFPKVNILELFRKPSMENIDNSLLGWETHNGQIIHQIVTSIREALTSPSIKKINSTLSNISNAWTYYLSSLYQTMDVFTSIDFKYGRMLDDSFSDILLDDSFSNILNELDVCPEPSNFTYDLSPIETLYLRIMQHQYIGQTNDILRIHKMRIDSNYDVPIELVETMRELHSNIVDPSDISNYIKDHAKHLAKYVYLKENVSKTEYRRLIYNGEKVPKILSFFNRTKCLMATQTSYSELFIVSCLQAILLDSSNETFDYTYNGYQKHKKHKPKVQGALKTEGYVIDSLKTYWTRKVNDHWYANIGIYNLRCKLREVENTCDSKLLEILNIPSISGMKKRHNFYAERLNTDIMPFLIELPTV